MQSICLLALVATAAGRSQQFSGSQLPYPGSQGFPSQFPGNQGGFPGSQLPYPGNQGFPGSQYPGNQFPGSQFPGNQYPGNQYPGSQFPGNQYPGSQLPYPGNQGFPGSGFPMGPGPALPPFQGQQPFPQQPFNGPYNPYQNQGYPQQYPYSNQGQQGGLFGNQGLLGGITGTLNSLLQQVLGTVGNIVQKIGFLLQGVTQDLGMLVNQLLNPQLPWAQKQPLIQQIVNTLPQNLQAAFNQVAVTLANLSQSLIGQPPQVQQAVSQVLVLPFSQQFRQLPAQQQQVQIQGILSRLNQQQLQIVANLLNQFAQQVNLASINVSPNINVGNTNLGNGNIGSPFGGKK